MSKTYFLKNIANSNKAKMATTMTGEMQAGISGTFVLRSQFS